MAKEKPIPVPKKHALVGRTISDVRILADHEIELIKDKGRRMALVLDDGTVLCPMDKAGLALIDRKDKVTELNE